MSALRRAGIDVGERHVEVMDGRTRLGPLGALRVAAAEVRLMIPRRRDFDALVVGYPGHFDVPQARGVAGRKPLLFLPRVSLTHELVERRGRFRPRSIAARVIHATDVRALKLADVVVTDADATADYLADHWDVGRDRIATIFAGAEERVFCEQWSPVYPFGALHVPQPGTGIATVLAAAALVPELPVRVAGGALPDAPANVEWVDAAYEGLGLAFAHAGVAIGSLEESFDDPRRGVPRARDRDAARHRRDRRRARAARRRRVGPARAAAGRGGRGGCPCTGGVGRGAAPAALGVRPPHVRGAGERGGARRSVGGAARASGRDRLRQQVDAQRERQEPGAAVLLTRRDGDRPRDVPDGQVRQGDEQEAEGEPAPSSPAPGLAQEPRVRDGERHEERPSGQPESMRERVRGLAARVLP